MEVAVAVMVGVVVVLMVMVAASLVVVQQTFRKNVQHCSLSIVVMVRNELQ